MFPKIRQAFNATPFQLGALPATRAPVESLFAIFGGYLAHTFNRKYTLATADFVYALFTLQTALVGKFNNLYGFMVGEGIVVAGLNQILSFDESQPTPWSPLFDLNSWQKPVLLVVGMAILIPSSYSLIVDMASRDFVGNAFGMQYSAGVFGVGIASLVGLAIGETTLGGLTGWRLFLGIVGVIALFWGFVTLLTTVDPRFEGKEFEAVVRTNQRSYWSLLKSFFTKPAMAGIIAQGILMQFPFNCFVFMTLFYEAIGFNAWHIGMIVFIFWMGSSVGGWFAGWLGGYAAKNYGGGMARIAVAQIGYALSVVTVCITFLAIPREVDHFSSYMAASFFFGTVSSWTAPACSSPLIADITTEEERNCAYGVERALEACFGAFTPMYMGKIIESAGYLDPEIYPGPETMAHNARVTGRTMAILVGSFWGGAIFVISYLYYAYPRALIKTEAAQLEEDNARRAAMQRISPDPLEKLRTDSASVYSPLVKIYQKVSMSSADDSPRSDISDEKHTKMMGL